MNFFSLFKRNLLYKIKKKILIDEDRINFESLDSLFHYYESDKANIFKRNKVSGHGYSIFYEKKLENLKNKKVNILEIGSFAGGSAAAFTKYLPQSNIFCFDINISNFKYKSKKLTVIDGSLQSKERDVPEYIQLDDKNKTAKLVRIPKFAEVPFPVIMEPSLVIEYYSR